MQILTPEIKQKIEALREHLPTSQSLVIPLLHEVQHKEGWVSIAAMKEMSQFLQIPVGRIQEVASFYTMFKLEKIGKVHVELCTNISCCLNGAEKVMTCLEKKLGIKAGETTADGLFTLSEVECLAACGTGPAATIQDVYYENLTEDEALKLIERFQKEQGVQK